MVAFVTRTLGLLIFAASFIALIADGVKSLAGDRVVATSLASTWTALDPGSLDRTRAIVEGSLGTYMWEQVAAAVLSLPTFVVGGTLGVALMMAGTMRRSRKRVAA